jgi:ABC-type bacteriocin/lantibiotic exporter with double-glycine peptidase domain
MVLDRVTIEVPPGSRIAIVGPSGSGKSTLARLLCGLYHPTEGSVRFDDLELFQVDLPSLRRQIGFVPQSAYLFAGSIRENIALGEPASRLGDVQAAAQLACIHDDIMNMPLRYDTLVAAAGGSLSGGQRQRVALARAVMNRPRILILDEATSHLDPITEAHVLANLSTLEATRIVIAHRLTTIQDSDRIYVLDGGRVVEQGTHGELMSRCGLYTDLYRSQAKEARV